MEAPKICQKAPYIHDVEAGKKYFWCSCGKSQKQPFCDGSHKGSDFSPLMFEATETKRIFFCGCKHSEKKPMCDGTHTKL